MIAQDASSVAAPYAEVACEGLRPQVKSTRAIVLFFVLTFGWTWGLWAINSLIKDDAETLSKVLLLASVFGPGLAAIVIMLLFEGGAGLHRWLRQGLRWRIAWHWYALAVVIPPLIMAAALAVDAALTGTMRPFPVADRLWMALAQFPLVLIFGGPLGEEFGWRGYALPALGARLGWRWASLIIGAAWGLWHLPLLFMTDTAQAQLPIALFLASTVGLSVVMARLSVNAGYSVIPALLLHSAINWCSMVLPIMPKDGDAQAYSLVAGITILVAIVALVKPGPNVSQFMMETMLPT